MNRINLILLSIISLIINLAILFINIPKIPGGYTAFGAFLLTTLISALIYVLTLVFSFIFSFSKNKFQDQIQLLIHGICIIMIAYSSWKICVYKEPIVTREEFLKIQLNEIEGLEHRALKILANSENRRPEESMVTSDSISILTHFAQFLDNNNISPAFKKDSLFHTRFSYFFNRILTNSDSIEGINYRKRILNSLSVDNLIYSPDQRFIFVIVTFETDTLDANAIVLIGQRYPEQLLLYKFPCNTFDNYGAVNKKYAQYGLICDLFEGGRPCTKGNPFKQSFWTNGYFEKIKYKGFEKYLYQVEELYNQPGKRFIEEEIPILIVAR